MRSGKTFAKIDSFWGDDQNKTKRREEEPIKSLYSKKINPRQNSLKTLFFCKLFTLTNIIKILIISYMSFK